MRLTASLLMAHSARQLKRARGHPRTWPPVAAAEVPAPLLATQPVRALPSGWAAPRGAAADVPFRVERTTVGRSVPVYTDIKNGGTRRLTLVRKVSGDVAALVEELRRVTGGAVVTARPGRVEIEGDRAKEVRTWLMGLGF